ncbi:hypothetical protein HK102_004898, partial [Quaeritorhiza haematococci]
MITTPSKPTNVPSDKIASLSNTNPASQPGTANRSQTQTPDPYPPPPSSAPSAPSSILPPSSGCLVWPLPSPPEKSLPSTPSLPACFPLWGTADVDLQPRAPDIDLTDSVATVGDELVEFPVSSGSTRQGLPTQFFPPSKDTTTEGVLDTTPSSIMHPVYEQQHRAVPQVSTHQSFPGGAGIPPSRPAYEYDYVSVTGSGSHRVSSGWNQPHGQTQQLEYRRKTATMENATPAGAWTGAPPTVVAGSSRRIDRQGTPIENGLAADPSYPTGIPHSSSSSSLSGAKESALHRSHESIASEGHHTPAIYANGVVHEGGHPRSSTFPSSDSTRSYGYPSSNPSDGERTHAIRTGTLRHSASAHYLSHAPPEHPPYQYRSGPPSVKSELYEDLSRGGSPPTYPAQGFEKFPSPRGSPPPPQGAPTHIPAPPEVIPSAPPEAFRSKEHLVAPPSYSVAAPLVTPSDHAAEYAQSYHHPPPTGTTVHRHYAHPYAYVVETGPPRSQPRSGGGTPPTVMYSSVPQPVSPPRPSSGVPAVLPGDPSISDGLATSFRDAVHIPPSSIRSDVVSGASRFPGEPGTHYTVHAAPPSHHVAAQPHLMAHEHTRHGTHHYMAAGPPTGAPQYIHGQFPPPHTAGPNPYPAIPYAAQEADPRLAVGPPPHVDGHQHPYASSSGHPFMMGMTPPTVGSPGMDPRRSASLGMPPNTGASRGAYPSMSSSYHHPHHGHHAHAHHPSASVVVAAGTGGTTGVILASTAPKGAVAAGATSSNTPKRYECVVCAKRFSRPSSLRTHMHSHTGEKPYQCTVEMCGRRFSVLSNLRRHMKVCIVRMQMQMHQQKLAGNVGVGSSGMGDISIGIGLSSGNGSGRSSVNSMGDGHGSGMDSDGTGSGSGLHGRYDDLYERGAAAAAAAVAAAARASRSSSSSSADEDDERRIPIDEDDEKISGDEDEEEVLAPLNGRGSAGAAVVDDHKGKRKTSSSSSASSGSAGFRHQNHHSSSSHRSHRRHSHSHSHANAADYSASSYAHAHPLGNGKSSTSSSSNHDKFNQRDGSSSSTSSSGSSGSVDGSSGSGGNISGFENGRGHGSRTGSSGGSSGDDDKRKEKKRIGDNKNDVDGLEISAMQEEIQ